MKRAHHAGIEEAELYMLLAKARVAKALPAPATDKRELQEEGGYTPNTKELRFSL